MGAYAWLIVMFVAALVVPNVFDDEGVLIGAAFLHRLRDAPRALRRLVLLLELVWWREARAESRSALASS